MTIMNMEFKDLKFDRLAYKRDVDNKRLVKQLYRIVNLMIDGVYRTLQQISVATGDPQASISAQLRHLRKKSFGAHQINKRQKNKQYPGLWEYQLIWNNHDGN